MGAKRIPEKNSRRQDGIKQMPNDWEDILQVVGQTARKYVVNLPREQSQVTIGVTAGGVREGQSTVQTLQFHEVKEGSALTVLVALGFGSKEPEDADECHVFVRATTGTTTTHFRKV